MRVARVTVSRSHAHRGYYGIEPPRLASGTVNHELCHLRQRAHAEQNSNLHESTGTVKLTIACPDVSAQNVTIQGAAQAGQSIVTGRATSFFSTRARTSCWRNSMPRHSSQPCFVPLARCCVSSMRLASFLLALLITSLLSGRLPNALHEQRARVCCGRQANRDGLLLERLELGRLESDLYHV